MATDLSLYRKPLVSLAWLWFDIMLIAAVLIAIVATATGNLGPEITVVVFVVYLLYHIYGRRPTA